MPPSHNGIALGLRPRASGPSPFDSGWGRRTHMFGGKMTRECVECGRTLRTGRKYCYTCRSLQKAGSHPKYNPEQKFILFFILGTACFMGAIYYLVHSIKEGNIWDGILVLIFFGGIGFFIWRYAIKQKRKQDKLEEKKKQ